MNDDKMFNEILRENEILKVDNIHRLTDAYKKNWKMHY